MTEIKLLNLNSSQELVKELDLQQSKLILGGQKTFDCDGEDKDYCDAMDELNERLEERERNRDEADYSSSEQYLEKD